MSKQLTECLACGTMTDSLDRLCSLACLEAMYDSIKIETLLCACGNDATHEVQGVGDTMADLCESCCEGCDEHGELCTADGCTGRITARLSATGQNVWDACNECGREC